MSQLHLTYLCIAFAAIGAIAYLVSVTRDARLGRRALQVLGSVGNEPPSMDTAYLRLHEIEQEDARIDELIEDGMRTLNTVRSCGGEL